MSDGSVLIDTLFDTTGFKKGLGSLQGIASKFGTGLKTAFKMGTIAIGTTATAIAGLAKASVTSYGQLEQLEGGAKKIFDEMDYEDIKKDAVSAWKTMNLSANEYLDSINTVGANFASTLGDKKGYETAKEGLQAISDFASGTGKNVLELNQKYQMITRSTSVYQSIADQFAGILPGTSKEFLAQAQAAGFLSNQYKNLTEVPMPEYQEALTKMLSKGTQQLGLTGNTAAETAETITGSIAGLKASWDNFLNGSGQISTVIETLKNAINNILNATSKLIPQLISSIAEAIPQILESAGQIIQALSDGITNNLPQILTCATSIINSLLQGLMQLLPEIAPVAVQMIFTIVEAILPQLPNVLDCGFKVVIELMKGITKELPSLLKMAPDIIKQLVEVLTNNLPELLDVAFELIQVLIEGLDEYIAFGVEYAPTIIEKIVNALMEALPKLMPVAVSIITTLIDVMTKNLPLMIECAYTLIIALAEGIIRNLPQILSAGGQIVWALINGIIQLIGNVGNAWQRISDKIKEKIDDFAWNQAGPLAGKVIRQFIQGIINCLGNVGEASQKIANKVKEKISNMASKAFTWGKDMVQGFVNGIKNMAGNVTSAASNLAGKVKSFLHFSRPDRGPLRDYEKWMPDMVQGLAKSLKKASPLLERQASALASKLQNAVNYETSLLGNSLASNGVLQIQRNAEITATLNSIDNDKEITVNAVTNLDSKVLTQAVNKVNARQKLAYGIS